MLLSQLKHLHQALPKRYSFFCKLMGIAIALNASMLGLLLLSGSGYQSLLIDTRYRPNDAPLVLIPLQKSVNKPLPVPTAAPTDPAKSKTLNAHHSSTTITNKTLLTAPQSAVAKTNVEGKKSETKKLSKVDKTISTPKLSQPVSPKVPPVETKRSATPKKITSPDPKKIVTVKKDKEVTPPALEQPLQESRQVGYQELSLIELTTEITYGIAQYWQRPSGLHCSMAATFKVRLDNYGVKTILIEKSSGAALYDLNAKKALLEYAFPKAAWNKTLTFIM